MFIHSLDGLHKWCHNVSTSLISPILQPNLFFFPSSASEMSCCLVGAKYLSHSTTEAAIFQEEGWTVFLHHEVPHIQINQ